MHGPPSRDQAAQLLGVSPGAPATEVRRAYRRLVREHHPDVGGDVTGFQQLQQAYECLASTAPRPSSGAVPRASPSRPGGAPVHGSDDPDAVAWQPPPDGSARLGAASLRSLLAREYPGSGHPIRAASRGPGSRLNNGAHLLTTELTAVLTVAPTRDDLGHGVFALTVRGGQRRNRRALDRADLAASWTRTRSSSVTRLRSVVALSGDPRRDAVRAVARLEALLTSMAWPLEQWRLRP